MNVVKTGGLKVNGIEVVLKAQVDQQTETVSAIDDRVTTVEQATYVTPDLLDASFVENNGIFQISIDEPNFAAWVGRLDRHSRFSCCCC